MAKLFNFVLSSSDDKNYQEQLSTTKLSKNYQEQPFISKKFSSLLF